ncbi:MAG TPA: HD domain-containing protein [Candidatus Kapabacteria bacterium]|nr:HD domain-containing protein [Candidatus Kapabacteria bacterium]
MKSKKTSNWQKVIRDPVHGLIHFEDNKVDRLIFDLINTREFQRLRRIKQLGMSDMVFPGASHTRFAHSIGVMHMARKFLSQIKREVKLSENEEVALCAAALLHDIGHGPFSHTFEKVTDQKHEFWSVEIIMKKGTDVNKKLSAFGKSLPADVAKYLTKNPKGLHGYLVQIVSSQMDADRFDYLLRDSLCTGTDYGRFDPYWLINHVHVDSEKDRLYLHHKALHAAETYLYARHHMYKSVYFHKATRSAEIMARIALVRFRNLLGNGGNVSSLAPGAPASTTIAFEKHKLSVEEYLALDDGVIWQLFRSFESSKDSLLKKLGSGLIHRQLYKSTDVSSEFSKNPDIMDFQDKASAILRKKHRDPETCFIKDSPSDTPYVGYQPDKEEPSSLIFVESPFGKMSELTDYSPLAGSMTQKDQIVRYHYPKELREDIQNLATQLFSK